MAVVLRLAFLLLLSLSIVSCGGGGGGGSKAPALDTDMDGTSDTKDTDDDNDGILDVNDAFPLDKNESIDTDGDKIGNNTDTDDDNDAIPDSRDAFPLDKNEYADFDQDGMGDNADTDDDNDGNPDTTDNLKAIVTQLDIDASSLFDTLFDESRGIIIGSDRNGKTLIFIDVKSGKVTQRISLDYMPENLTLSADKSKLFVTLATKNHDYYWFDNQIGYVQVVDLQTIKKSNLITLNFDPFDIVATPSNKLLVSGGSGQWTYIRMIDATTGTLESQQSIYQGANLTLSQDGTTLAAIETNNSWIYTFTVSEKKLQADKSSYISSTGSPNQVWITPDNKYIITKSGDILSYGSFTSAKKLSDNYSKLVTNVQFISALNLAVVSFNTAEVTVINLSSMEAISKTTLFGNIKSSGLVSDFEYYLTTQAGISSLIKFEHPCLKCEFNLPPQTNFTYTPLIADTSAPINFDASTSTDPEKGNLSYRWDFDSDGIWDTAFSTSPQASKLFYLPGNKFVRTQAKDDLGSVSTVTKTISVAQGVYKGEAVTNAIPNLPSYSIYKSLNDQASEKLYIIDSTRHKLYVVNLATGMSERSFTFEGYLDNLSISADGKELAVTELIKQRNEYIYPEPHQTQLHLFNLQKQGITLTSKIDFDVYSVAALGNGYLALIYANVSSNNFLQGFDMNTGAFTGLLYGANYNDTLTTKDSSNFYQLSYWGVIKFQVDASGTISSNNIAQTTPNYSDGYRGWASGDGKYLITQGNRLIDLSTMSLVGSAISNYGIDFVVFDNKNSLAFIVGYNNIISVVNLLSGEKVREYTNNGEVTAVAIGAQTFSTIVEIAGISSISTINHPCPACSNNQPPAASFALTSTSSTTADDFTFDAKNSTDPESTQLAFRWDLDGNGTWDNAFSNASTTTKHYSFAGKRVVKMQARDSAGLVTTTTKEITIAQGKYAGKLDGVSKLSSLKEITDSLYDKISGNLLVISEQRLNFINPTTSIISKYIEFELKPTSLQINLAANKLYIALGEPTNNYYSIFPTKYVAVIDLNDFTYSDNIETPNFTTGFTVSPNGKLVGQADSALNYTIPVINTITKTQVSSIESNRIQSTPFSHTTNEWIYIIGSDLKRYDISSNSPIVAQASVDSSYNVRIGTKLWVSNSGEFVITAGGDVLYSDSLKLYKKLAKSSTSISESAFDESGKVALILTGNGELAAYNTTSWEKISTLQTGIYYQTRIWFTPTGYLLLSNSGNGYSVSNYNHPCQPCTSNKTPTATFSYTPTNNLSTAESITFDASSSSDPDSGNTLYYRWDFDDDGVWDTDFSTQKTTTKHFSIAGPKTVVLQVKDEFAASNLSRKTLQVAHGVDAGTPVSNSTAYVPSFNVNYSVLDKSHNYLFASDSTAKRVYILDLSTGLTLKYFDFEFTPEVMAISPSGNTLYIALTTKDHSPYWWTNEQEGYLAKVDLSTQSIVTISHINIDPYDLAVLDENKIVISSGSGQWTTIAVFDTTSNSKLSEVGIYERARLALSADLKNLFTTDTALYPSDLRKHSLNSSNITLLFDSPYHGDYRINTNLWITPSGNHIISAGGDAFFTTDLKFAKSITQSGESILALDSNKSTNELFILTSKGTINIYNADDLTYKKNIGLNQTNAINLYSTGSKLYYLGKTVSGYILVNTPL